MIQNFSSGYYQAAMNVQEYDDGPVIERQLYDFIDSHLYTVVDRRPVMQVGVDGAPFSVDYENVIPRETLALPPDMVEETGEVNVFLLKPEYIDTMVNYYDG